MSTPASESAWRDGRDRGSRQRHGHRPDLRGVPGQCSRPRLRYVDDVVDTFVRAGCATPKTTGTYNIGTGQHTAFTGVHGVMSAVLDGSTPPSLCDDHSDELNSIPLNASKAAKELDWKPTVDLAEGLRRTIRWLCATLEPEAPALLGA